jgi:DNA end-binding protein Ku
MASRRSIWSGAISFGLVNIPVSLHTATVDSGLDFDWLDQRTMDLVGYKRINKKTGLEVESEDIVKGIAYEKGRYVVITDEEIRQALPKSTQTIEIESFVSAAEIPLAYFERPYYLVPAGTAVRAYTLLREALLSTELVGLSRVVIHTKQHLAAIIPEGPALVLILLRWTHQLRPVSALELPPEGESGLVEREFFIARELVEAMAEPWNPHKFKDSFTDQVMALVDEKVKTGRIETVERPAAEAGAPAAEVIDLTELLRNSLQSKIKARKAKARAKAGKTGKSAGDKAQQSD